MLSFKLFKEGAESKQKSTLRDNKSNVNRRGA
jgi:hypothetical protein